MKLCLEKIHKMEQRIEESDCLTIFPYEIWRVILSFLDFKEYTRTSRACSFFSFLIFKEKVSGPSGDYRIIKYVPILKGFSTRRPWFHWIEDIKLTNSELWYPLFDKDAFASIVVIRTGEHVRKFLELFSIPCVRFDQDFKDTGNLMKDCLNYYNWKMAYKSLRNFIFNILKENKTTEYYSFSRYEIKDKKLIQGNQLFDFSEHQTLFGNLFGVVVSLETNYMLRLRIQN